MFVPKLPAIDDNQIILILFRNKYFTDSYTKKSTSFFLGFHKPPTVDGSWLCIQMMIIKHTATK